MPRFLPRLLTLATLFATLPGVAPAAPLPTAALLDGQECVNAAEAGANLGLRIIASGAQPGLGFERNGREAYLSARERAMRVDGVKVYLGMPAEDIAGRLVISRIDYEKKLLPLMRPDLSPPIRHPRIIVLDPGHGGWDPGAENLALGVREKEATLDVAFRLRQILVARGWTVYLTRTTDTALADKKETDAKRKDLDARGALANRNHADLFVSIHFDADQAKTLQGTEIFSLAPAHQWASDDWEAHAKPHPKGSGPLVYDTPFPGNSQDPWNALLAHSLYRGLPTRLASPDLGERIAHWWVLRNLDCPGVLVEPAYLSKDSEALRVRTASFRQQVAEALAEGLAAYAEEVDRLNGARATPR